MRFQGQNSAVNNLSNALMGSTIHRRPFVEEQCKIDRMQAMYESLRETSKETLWKECLEQPAAAHDLGIPFHLPVINNASHHRQGQPREQKNRYQSPAG